MLAWSVTIARCSEVRLRGCRIGWGAVALSGSDAYNRADMTWDCRGRKDLIQRCAQT